jgi:hypothetical protein
MRRSSVTVLSGIRLQVIATKAAGATFHVAHRHAEVVTLPKLNQVYIKLPMSTSDQTRLPAEFKHITKRRKRNQKGFPE